MTHKILMPLYDEAVAPRFDLATEVLLAECTENGRIRKERVLILPGPSAEKMCHMIITEGIDTVICGGIEEEFYDYLNWKRIQVIDDVIGPGKSVLERFSKGELSRGDIIRT
jgi:predicted Fe-Mo cluster-binding NifX family protein